MVAKELFDEIMGMTLGYPMLLPKLRSAHQGAINDVLDVNRSYYYQWSSLLVGSKKPKQVVELGGAMGVWSICVLHKLPKDSDLYSITLEEDGLEFSFVVDDYPNFHPIVGNDLDMDNWKGVDLSKTDLWFFDAEHTEEHLRKELDLYSPFFKKGAIILIDDIHSFGLDPVWDDIKTGKWGITDAYDATNPLHYSGFGVCIYGR